MHPLISPNELIDLVIAVIVLPLFVRVADVRHTPSMRAFTAGYLLWIGALAATIAEGFVWPDAINLLEHVCYTAAGVAFLVGTVFLLRARTPERGERR